MIPYPPRDPPFNAKGVHDQPGVIGLWLQIQRSARGLVLSPLIARMLQAAHAKSRMAVSARDRSALVIAAPQ